MLRFHVLMVVWGEPYIDVMVKLTIPTLLYDGNLPTLAARHDCRMVFLTRAVEEARIREAPTVRRLAALMPIEFIHFDPDGASDIYVAMSDAHFRGCSAAREAGAKGIFLFPDGIFANGSLAKLGEYAEQGKTAVVCPAPRLVQETTLPVVLPRIESTPMSCRELVHLTRQYLHPQLRRNFADSWNFSVFPTFVCWSLGAKGMLMRGLHLHPLMIDFSRITGLDALKAATFDSTLLGDTLESWSDVHVETDSDNIYVCSLTPAAALYSESWYRPFTLPRLHNTAYGPMFNSLHRFYFTKALKLHVEDLDDEWRRVEEDTAWIAEALQARPLSVVRHRPPWWPMRLIGRVMAGLQDRRVRASGHQY